MLNLGFFLRFFENRAFAVCCRLLWMRTCTDPLSAIALLSAVTCCACEPVLTCCLLSLAVDANLY